MGSHITAQLKGNMENTLGIRQSTSKMKETSAKRIKFDEQSVEKCCNVLDTWASVFEDSSDIVSLSSGVNASSEVQKDLLRAKEIGEQKSSTFIQERIKTNNVPFNDPIKKNNLNTFSSMKVKKSIKVKDKDVLIKADRDFFGRMLILQEKRGNINGIYVSALLRIVSALKIYTSLFTGTAFLVHF